MFESKILHSAPVSHAARSFFWVGEPIFAAIQ